MTEPERHVEELLDRYRTGELDAAARRRVEAHLEACEGCRSALAALEDFSRTVERAYAAEAAAPEREPDWGRMRAAIAARTTAPPRRSWLARHVPQTAAAVVALVALGVLWQQGIRSPEEADRALRTERPAALSDRDASSADRSAAASPGGAARLDTTAAAETDRFRTSAEERTIPNAAESPGEGLDKREGARQPEAARAGAPEPAPAAEARGRIAETADAQEDTAVSETQFDLHPDSAVVAPAAPAEEIGVAQKVGGPPPDLERFQSRARLALSDRDSALAAAALAQWRDSLSAGEDLPPDLRRAAEVLADSLAAFLAARP